MKGVLTEIFGMILAGSAVVLVLWEWRTFRNREEALWLITRRRFHRRLFVAAILGAIGVVMALEGSGAFAIRNPGALIVYAASLTTLSILLVILAGVDLVETLRSAADHSLKEFGRSVEEQRRAGSAPGDGPPEP